MGSGVSMFGVMGDVPGQNSFAVVPPQRGRQFSAEGTAYSVGRLPTDSLGVTEVTFAGVMAGSEIHVYSPDEAEVAGAESCASDQILSWPTFAAGSSNNVVTITIIKRGLRWQKFLYVSQPGQRTIQIFPVPDLGYSNPA